MSETVQDRVKDWLTPPEVMTSSAKLRLYQQTYKSMGAKVDAFYQQARSWSETLHTRTGDAIQSEILDQRYKPLTSDEMWDLAEFLKDMAEVVARMDYLIPKDIKDPQKYDPSLYGDRPQAPNTRRLDLGKG